MKIKRWFNLLILSLPLFASGCALQAGDKVIGIQSGKFFYTDGILTTEYYAPFEKVWQACEKTLFDMNATDVFRDKKIAKVELTAVILDENVRIVVGYKEKNVTTVSIRIGVAGNKLAATLIDEKIKKNLAR